MDTIVIDIHWLLLSDRWHDSPRLSTRPPTTTTTTSSSSYYIPSHPSYRSWLYSHGYIAFRGWLSYRILFLTYHDYSPWCIGMPWYDDDEYVSSHVIVNHGSWNDHRNLHQNSFLSSVRTTRVTLSFSEESETSGTDTTTTNNTTSIILSRPRNGNQHDDYHIEIGRERYESIYTTTITQIRNRMTQEHKYRGVST